MSTPFLNWRKLRYLKLKANGIKDWTKARLTGPSPEQGGAPRGFFSGLAMVVEGRIQGEVFPQKQKVPVPQPNSEIITYGLGQASGESSPFYFRMPSTRLLGPGLVPHDERGFACEEAMFGPQRWSDPVLKGGAAVQAEFLPGSWISLVSRWDDGSNYYHWISDSLSRLVIKSHLPPKIGILLRPSARPFVLDSLAELGLGDRIRFTESDHLVVEDFHFLSPGARSGCCNPIGYSWLRETFMPVTDVCDKDILITRRAATRTSCGLEELEEALESKGWSVVDPSQLTFREQVNLFSKASRVVGIHGAGMTNIIWTPSGTAVTELMPNTFRNACYQAISLAIGNSHKIVHCPANKRGDMEISRQIIDDLLLTI